MNTEIATTQSFQERMFERVREQMGDLMTDEELKKIVDAAMQKAFFEERIEKDNYDRISGRKPPLFIELIKNEMEKAVKEQTQAWLSSHEEVVVNAIQEMIGKGFLQIVQEHVDQKARQPLWDFASQLRQKGVLL